MKVMNPEPARDIAEIEKKMTAWRSDIRYLQEAGGDDKVMLNMFVVSWRAWDVLLVYAVPFRLELTDDVAALIAAEQLDAVLLRLDPVLTHHTDTLSATSRAARNAGSAPVLASRTVSFAELLGGKS